jgi:hypothetical protein
MRVHVNDIYLIKVNGHLELPDSHWPDGFMAECGYDPQGNPLTILRGPVVDQAELRGLLNQIWDLNLELLYLSKEEAF